MHIQWHPIVFSIRSDDHNANLPSAQLCLLLFPGCHFCFLLSRTMLRGLLIIADSPAPRVIAIYNELPPLAARSAQWCHTPLCAQISITFHAVMSCDPISTVLEHH